MDSENAEQVILARMHQTRSALADKLETLENQVVDTVQSAASAVAETVESVKEAVHDTVTTVTDSVQGTVTTVKESFDLRLQVERHPWAIMGGAVALGYIAARLLARGSDSTRGSRLPAGPAQSNGVHSVRGETNQIPPSRRTEVKEPREGGLVELLGPEIARAKGVVLGAVLGSVRNTIVDSLPNAIRDSMSEVIDRITEKLGGEVAPRRVSTPG